MLTEEKKKELQGRISAADDSLDVILLAHDNVRPYCPRGTAPEYGGPGECSDCDRADTIRALLAELRDLLCADEE